MRSQLRSYLRSLLHRRTVESDMEAELRTHLELRAQDLERTGLSPAEALRKARVEFGAQLVEQPQPQRRPHVLLVFLYFAELYPRLPQSLGRR